MDGVHLSAHMKFCEAAAISAVMRCRVDTRQQFALSRRRRTDFITAPGASRASVKEVVLVRDQGLHPEMPSASDVPESQDRWWSTELRRKETRRQS